MKKFTFVCVLVLVFVVPLTALADPSSATLDFIYRATGKLTVNVKLNEEVSSRACRIRYRATVYHENDEPDDKFVYTQEIASRLLIKGRKSSSLRPDLVRGVLPRNGEDAVLAIQASINCPGQARILTNALARFVKCGATVRRLSGRAFLAQLRQNLRDTR